MHHVQHVNEGMAPIEGKRFESHPIPFEMTFSKALSKDRSERSYVSFATFESSQT